MKIFLAFWQHWLVIRCDYKISCYCCCYLTLAGGQVNGFSPKHKLNTVVMKRSSTGKETMRLPLKSKVDSCKYENDVKCSFLGKIGTLSSKLQNFKNFNTHHAKLLFSTPSKQQGRISFPSYLGKQLNDNLKWYC